MKGSPGTLSRAGLDAYRVPGRPALLGGRFEADAVPGWGTTVTGAWARRAGSPRTSVMSSGTTAPSTGTSPSS
ncbi:hypothetical protein IAG44_03435 [Streptomyces roseirectus]|uniref:Uncharacterized protein n=1 Tax=Streptomyces roseirectus TaxID=2768066 RepID=A0A7H0I751_9ACTN|nr:hypothetical protein [Streptomyces roseirectus]QNP68617.1 hypothetical protein IAG44_03435 [Streptomyces roseirectus]